MAGFSANAAVTRGRSSARPSTFIRNPLTENLLRIDPSQIKSGKRLKLNLHSLSLFTIGDNRAIHKPLHWSMSSIKRDVKKNLHPDRSRGFCLEIQPTVVFASLEKFG